MTLFLFGLKINHTTPATPTHTTHALTTRAIEHVKEENRQKPSGPIHGHGHTPVCGSTCSAATAVHCGRMLLCCAPRRSASRVLLGGGPHESHETHEKVYPQVILVTASVFMGYAALVTLQKHLKDLHDHIDHPDDSEQFLYATQLNYVGVRQGQLRIHVPCLLFAPHI